MVEAIVRDKKRILPTIAHLDGQYGESGVYVGVPAVLGANGVERVLEISLNDAEQAAFSRSVADVRDLMKILPQPQYAS
jgi:malate dehydrogenase